MGMRSTRGKIRRIGCGVEGGRESRGSAGGGSGGTEPEHVVSVGQVGVAEVASTKESDVTLFAVVGGLVVNEDDEERDLPVGL